MVDKHTSEKKHALIVVNLTGFLCFLWNDIKLLARKGYTVSVAANGKMKDGTWAVEIPKLNQMGIDFYHIDFDTKSPASKQNRSAYKQLKDVLNKTNYDVVHCHTPIAGLITRIATMKYRKKGMKVIYTTHGFTFTDRSDKKTWFVYYNIEKFASMLSDAVITINHEDYNNAKKMFCKKVFCISGVGVDTKRFNNVDIDRDKYRESLGVRKDEIMILSVGELSDRKNHQIIIKAIATLPDKERYVYVICGREVVNSGVKEQLISLGKETGVKLILPGHRLDIPEINRCADIAAIPSLREGLGLAGIEALASGVPVIGSDVQGIREYVIDGYDGYLCNPDSEEEFALAISKLSEMKEDEKIRMKNNCHEIAEKFDKSVSNGQMEDIYREILGV